MGKSKKGKRKNKNRVSYNPRVGEVNLASDGSAAPIPVCTASCVSMENV
jgi:hypothetical protein